MMRLKIDALDPFEIETPECVYRLVRSAGELRVVILGERQLMSRWEHGALLLSPVPNGARSCRNFSPWNMTEDHDGERVDPRSCYTCGMYEHEHTRDADNRASEDEPR